MLKSLIKLIHIVALSVLFLNPAFAVEPVLGQRIAVGGYDGLFVDETGKVWSFDSRPDFIMNDSQFVYISNSGGTFFVIKKDGSLWGWGQSEYGELGIQTKSSSEKVEPRQILPSVQSIAIGGENVFALKPDGSLWAWGSWGSSRGDKIRKNRTTPRKLMNQVKMVSAGQYLTFALKKDGSLWGWGWNQCGGLGDGTRKVSYQPRRVNVKNLKGRKISSVATHLGDSYAITEDGLLWKWGYRHFTRLTCNILDPLIPTRVKNLDQVKNIALGWKMTALLKKDGSVWFLKHWDLDEPEKHLRILEDVEEITAAYAHFLALKKDGSVWVWGWDNFSSDELKDHTLQIKQIFFPKN